MPYVVKYWVVFLGGFFVFFFGFYLRGQKNKSKQTYI